MFTMCLCVVGKESLCEHVNTPISDTQTHTFRMVDNSSSSLFMLRRSGSVLILILCCVLRPTTALDTGVSDKYEKVRKVIQKSSHWFQEVDLDPGAVNIDPTWNPEVSEVLNVSLGEEEAFNVTEHRGFLHGFVESLSVILVSEIGDKTFFIAAILAMSNNKLTVND